MRLIDGVNRNLPTFHRYLKLRQRMMKVPELHYYDLYAPLVASVDLTYTADDAEKQVLEALAPLGPEYAAAAKRAFTERWIDLYPNDGKRAGAYSNGGAYDVHPYMLLNYNGKYTDVSTLAHELGHTMHSFFSNKTQPFATAGYPTFVAEVASTFNEALLIENMLKTITDPAAQAVAARQLSREHQGHGVPPDAVRRVRAARPRDDGEGPAAHRRGARQAVRRDHAGSTTGRTRGSRSWTTTSRTSGRSSRTSTATSTCSSTRPPSPPRRPCPRRSRAATRRRRNAT